MKASEIREKFLQFFASHGHTIVPSSSLVPENDPTLLFTNAGMNQFKDVFLGKDPRPYTRAVSTQKCVRAGGKHNDLENVGFTARHHTFFEMLGNFSFGDYFKKEAIHYAWKFVTEVLKLPKDRLYVTVFEKDDEAAEIWHHQEGVPRDRIYRFGEKDNFWSMGETGPCGPCSELFIDRGEKYSCGKSTCGMGCDCDRYMEFWNLVFMQFDRDSSGKLTPLPKPSVDTGAGLERIAAILQEVDTNYDTDLFLKILDQTAGLLGRKFYPKDEDAVSFRVIADHSRAAAFLVCDGVLPSNEGRGYVLRRIMRRAIRHGKKLGFSAPFLYKTAGFVIDQMKDAFPSLATQRPLIERAILAEEEQFLKTLERGLSLLDDEVGKMTSSTLPGAVAFKLYDTYGFPLDLTRVILEERKLSLDEAGFHEAMQAQKAESRKNWKGSGQEALDAVYLKLMRELQSQGALPKFVGYEKLSASGKCLALLELTPQGLKRSDAVSAHLLASGSTDSADQETVVEAVFAETPFYGESGGQVGDRGRVSDETGDFQAEVLDVQKPIPELIVVQLKLLRGTIRVGLPYLQESASEIRALTARNHTATHLLHWALREVLGTHVKQAGSLVTPDLLRFDFSHFQAMNPDELKKVEDLINAKIWSNDKIQKREMSKESAVQAGAIAFFGEKYGDLVRVISVGDYSVELCGGTHIDHSSEIHLFKIVSESGIAAGVRRIIAYTSKGAFQYLRGKLDHLVEARDRLKANSTEEVSLRIERLLESERHLRKQIEKFQSEATSHDVERILAQEISLPDGYHLYTGTLAADPQGIKKLREVSDRIRQKVPRSVVILGMPEVGGSKVNLLVSVGPQGIGKYHAGEILKPLLPFIDGKGGGKPDQAQAGGSKPSGLDALFKQAHGTLTGTHA
jgi:alanyl-tRNA synthetase